VSRATDFTGPARERPRCLGAAIFTALHLMAQLGEEEGHSPGAEPRPKQQDMSRGSRAATSGRLMVITTGPTTKVRIDPASNSFTQVVYQGYFFSKFPTALACLPSPPDLFGFCLSQRFHHLVYACLQPYPNPHRLGKLRVLPGPSSRGSALYKVIKKGKMQSQIMRAMLHAGCRYQVITATTCSGQFTSTVHLICTWEE